MWKKWILNIFPLCTTTLFSKYLPLELIFLFKMFLQLKNILILPTKPTINMTKFFQSHILKAHTLCTIPSIQPFSSKNFLPCQQLSTILWKLIFPFYKGVGSSYVILCLSVMEFVTNFLIYVNFHGNFSTKLTLKLDLSRFWVLFFLQKLLKEFVKTVYKVSSYEEYFLLDSLAWPSNETLTKVCFVVKPSKKGLSRGVEI